VIVIVDVDEYGAFGARPRGLETVLSETAPLLSATRPAAATQVEAVLGWAADRRKRCQENSTPTRSRAEGSGRWGKDRIQHHLIAAGSAAEVKATLGLARVWGFVDGAVAEKPEALLVRVQAMLWRLSQGRG